MFESVAALRAVGFVGFVKVAELVATRCGPVPAAPGVYVIIRRALDLPVFLPANPAGRLRGRDPSLPAAELNAAWVPGAIVLYLGKAGGAATRATLRTRLSAYLRHGRG